MLPIQQHVHHKLVGSALQRNQHLETGLVESKELGQVVEYEKVDEKLYYNLRLHNDEVDQLIPLEFNINRVDPIISDNTHEWEIGVENFSIGTGAYPIFDTSILIGRSREYTVFFLDANTNTVYEQDVDFLFVNDDSKIYNYSDVLYATNRAMALLWQEHVQSAEYDAPPFIKREGEKTFEFWFPTGFYSDATDIINRVDRRFKVIFSPDLYQLFGCFDAVRLRLNRDDPNYLNIDGSYKLGATLTQGHDLREWDVDDYAVITQQWDVRPNMTDFTRIIFLTDIPVRDELVGEAQSTQQSQILDYIISNRINDRKNINYFPRFIKWNNLINAGELRRMTVRAMLERRDGNLVQYKLAENENFFMKLVFRRKQV
jgi:hypothetical protein